MWFEIYEDSCQWSEKPWRWRLRTDHDVIASSTNGYGCEGECESAIRALSNISPTISIRRRARTAARARTYPQSAVRSTG
jgi:uncharacterized protein YegP (UPF0339 family)